MSVSTDSALLQIVDAALLVTARKSGPWLVCKPGCSQCCVGVFAINQLDAARLREGLEELSSQEPERALRVRQRGVESLTRLVADFPGDPESGLLDPGAEDSEQFAAFANDEVCPALDPDSNTCDLYAWRPMTCRVFGPPVRSEDGLGVCELCFHGATAEEIATCEMIPDPDNLESTLVARLEKRSGTSGKTIVAFSLAG